MPHPQQEPNWLAKRPRWQERIILGLAMLGLLVLYLSFYNDQYYPAWWE